MLFQTQIFFILLLNDDIADTVLDLCPQIFTFHDNSDANTGTDTNTATDAFSDSDPINALSFSLLMFDNFGNNYGSH